MLVAGLEAVVTRFDPRQIPVSQAGRRCGEAFTMLRGQVPDRDAEINGSRSAGRVKSGQRMPFRALAWFNALCIVALAIVCTPGTASNREAVSIVADAIPAQEAGLFHDATPAQKPDFIVVDVAPAQHPGSMVIPPPAQQPGTIAVDAEHPESGAPLGNRRERYGL